MNFQKRFQSFLRLGFIGWIWSVNYRRSSDHIKLKSCNQAVKRTVERLDCKLVTTSC